MRRLSRELLLPAAVVIGALVAVLVYLRMHPIRPPQTAPWQVGWTVRERYGAIPFDAFCKAGFWTRRCYAILRGRDGADVLALNCPLFWRCEVVR